jgi:phosphorylcholine metabolism protein LicD
MKEEKAIEILKEIKEVFDAAGISYWLDCGTLLGAVREQRIIPWDNDIDFGVREEDWTKILSILSEFKKRRFYIEVEDFRLPNSYTYKLILLFRSGWFIGIQPYILKGKNAIRLDIRESFIARGLIMVYHLLVLNKAHVAHKNELFLRVANNLVALTTSKLRKPLSQVILFMLQALRRICFDYYIIVVPRHHFEKLSTIKFYGETFSVPCDVEKYLEHRYGKDWRIPKKEWKEWEWWKKRIKLI